MAVRWGFTVPNSRNLEKCTSVQLTFFLCFGPFRLLPKISPHFINQNTLNVFVLRIIIPQRNKDQKKMSNIYIKILIHVYVYYCNSLVLKKLESLKWGSFLVVHYNKKYLKNEGCFYHRIKPLSKCLRHKTKLKCNNIKTLCNRQADLLITFVKIESIISTSTILSTQRWINRIIATSHSKMGILLESMKVALSSNKAVTYILVFEA